MALVEIRGLSKFFGTHQVLRDINIDVERGEVVSIIGPSGSGKSTLLRCVNFLEEYDGGTIHFGGQLVGRREASNGKLVRDTEHSINRMRAEIGIIFQGYNLFPHMTVLQNIIEAPIRVRNKPKAEAVAIGEALLKRVGMLEKKDAYPERLSGGQQQRVAIVRALAMEPKLVLFDEVTSALDPELVQEVLDVMTQLARDGMTMIVVTHEMRFARQVSDKIVFMEDGRLVEQGTPEILFQSAENPRLKAFLAKAHG